MTAATSARSLRMNHWNGPDGLIELPIDPFAIADKLDIDVRIEPLEPNVAGFILKEENEPASVVLNANDSVERQRFTLAHELGHFVSHEDEPEIGFVDYRDEISSTGASAEERWANAFAAELIMPAAAVKKWWASGQSFETIRRRLNVSKAALAVRISSLGLVR